MITNYNNKAITDYNEKEAATDSLKKQKNRVINMIHELYVARELNEKKLNKVIQVLKE